MTAKKTLSKGRISKLAANPGTRAALADKYLTGSQLKQRNLNKRLDTPVVDGSALTNRQLSHQADAAAKLNFGGDPVAQAQGQARDTAGWYDQYKAEVSRLRGDVTANTAQANTAAQNLTGAVGMLGASQAVGDGTVRADADKASAVRQALSSSFGATQARLGSNTLDYAANLGDVVVPGQKLNAQLTGAQGVKSAKDQLAAFVTKYRGDAIAGETTAQNDAAKLRLAEQTLAGTTANQQTQAELDAARVGETTRHNKASETITSQTAAEKRSADAAKVNQYGYTNAQWQSMTTGARQKAIKDFRSSTKGASGKGPAWVTPSQQSSFQSDFDKAKSYAKQLLASKGTSRAAAAAALQGTVKEQAVYDPKTGKKKLNADGTQVTTGSWTGVSSAVASAALDAATSGHLSAYTVKKLIAAGIKPSSLGVPTAGQLRSARKKQNKANRVANDAISVVGSAVSGLG